MSAQEFAAQFSTARRIADALDESTRALLGAQSLRAQVKELSQRSPAPLAAQLSTVDSHAAALLEAPESEPATPPGLEQLDHNLTTLYAQTAGADAAPTAAQLSETERALTDWTRLQPRWQQLRAETSTINQDLKRHHLAVLTADTEPPRDVDFADDD